MADQLTRIAVLERALWSSPEDTAMLAAYQRAHRDLEVLIAEQGDDWRHQFVVVIPVADSPRQLGSCLNSLLALCRAYGYGGETNGRFDKVAVLLADDSLDRGNAAAHRALAGRVSDEGLAVEYFGVAEQQALLRRLDGVVPAEVIGCHDPIRFGHKGQAMTRNITQLRLAEIARQRPGIPLLFYSVDADQTFQVCIPGRHGRVDLPAISYFHVLDWLFAQHDIAVLTGKVVGDPPVSPAVMAANFLDDVAAFLDEMAAADPDAVYPQSPRSPVDGADAAYHDMAELFGFAGVAEAHRYRCGQPGRPSHAACFEEFAKRLNGFFHGEHPTRTTWFEYRKPRAGVTPARTVYTGNTVFTPDALEWFIPFAPLRLRMSGPTMGRLLQAEIADRFVSANLPMLHTRTLQDTHAAEFRPGVVTEADRIDLADEFERQFFGDRMLFSIERLVALGYPANCPSATVVGQTLDEVGGALRDRYAAKQERVVERLAEIETDLRDASQWWWRPSLAQARDAFERFLANVRHNFGTGSPGMQRIDDAERRRYWRDHQSAAVMGLADVGRAWRHLIRQQRAD